MKDKKKVLAGRLGGLKGGKARALLLSKQQRSEIAKKAASIRWKKEKEKPMQWKKQLSSSDAQENVPVGSKMPFLRFTKEKYDIDHFTWFRDQFFGGLHWVVDPVDSDKETADININVTLLGKPLGVRKMKLDHQMKRSKNHGAPTTHLNYDHTTRQTLESMSLSGHTVVVTNQNGGYSLDVV